MELEQEVGGRKLVCFQLHDQEYAADIRFIKESLTYRPITKVPLTPAWLAGIVNLRGDVVAIIDISLFLGMRPTRLSPETRIVVARYQQRRIGFLCDRLCDLRIESLAGLQPPPTTLPEESTAILSGVLTLEDGRALRVLDLVALFESHQLAAFRRGERS